MAQLEGKYPIPNVIMTDYINVDCILWLAKIEFLALNIMGIHVLEYTGVRVHCIMVQDTGTHLMHTPSRHSSPSVSLFILQPLV